MMSESVAQNSQVDEYVKLQAQMKKIRMMQELDSGVFFLEREAYVEADAKFKYVLSNIERIPSDLTFYFGKNSYFLDQYSQSIDWLNKYIQLKGTSGQHYQEAVQLLKKSEERLLAQRKLEASQTEKFLSKNYDIDCGPTGKVPCPVCKGSHVIIKKGLLGDHYQTCAFCDDHGILTCEEYNLLLRGELEPKN